LNAEFLRFARARIRFGVGLDYQVTATGEQRGAVVCANITRGLPIRSGSFDHAVLLAVLEHLKDPGALLREIHRILVPGGSLIMTWPSGVVDSILIVTRAIGWTSPDMESEEHVARIPVETLIGALSQIGFDGFVHKTFELGLNNLLVAHKPGARTTGGKIEEKRT
jgi:SAM-dependent methyltransferase